jgi:hypothetical protein
MILDHNSDLDINKVKETLRLIDRPFIQMVWDSAFAENSNDPFGKYIKNISMPQYREYTWQHSDKEDGNNSKKTNDSNIENGDCDIEKLKEKYGYGYPDNEYFLFEKKYQQLRPSAKMLTTFHEEFFREYCINKVKETHAKAKGDFKEAKEWANMAKDSATAGKLNPNQMSKSDLSGGLDTFGQAARMVEETEEGELLGLLPKFIERPKDKVDIVLWLYVNYVRDLKGLPEADYKDIWKFYDIRKQSYESQMLDNELTKEDEEGEIDG